LTVNGLPIEREVEPEKTLLRFLREDLGLAGTKNGCEKGHCGTCTVIVDGEAKRSCLIRMGRAAGLNITTIEGIPDSSDGTPHYIRAAFLAEGAVQCGFCTPGMILATKALLDKVDAPSVSDVKNALTNNLCRCTGYAAIERAVLRAARIRRGLEPMPGKDGQRVVGVGSPAVRKDSPAKARGKPVYADDLPARRPLIGKLLFSAHPHARILEVDVSQAEQAEGVALVLTAKDVPGRNAFGLYVPQQPVIAQDEVKYLGDVVAAVFAETREQAERARNLISVAYEPLPPQLSATENLEPDAPLLHQGTENNVVHHVSVRKGDAEAAFTGADVVVEGRYYTPAIEHAYLEPESCLAEPDGLGGIVVRTGSQGSQEYQEMIAESLDLPVDKVRVIMTACGGAFGGKEEPAGQIHAAIAALRTGRPAKVVLSREESIRISTKRHPMHVWMRHAAAKDGRLLAVSSRAIADAGSYVSLTKPVVFRSAVTATGPYEVPNFSADSYGVYTHNNPSGAFRGFGSTQACFAAEIQMDKLARELGMDPAEFRRINGYRPGAVTGTGQTLGEGVGFRGCLDAVAGSLEVMHRELSGAERPANIRLGFGIACSYKNVGIGVGLSDHAGAGVELLRNGRVEVRTGAAEMGQGSDTLAAQIASDVLGVPYGLIDVVSCDTAVSPDGGMTTGSRQTFVTGNAVKGAAEALKDELAGFWPEGTPDADALAGTYRAAKSAGASVLFEYTYRPPKTYPHRTNADPEPGREPEEYDIHYAYCYAACAAAVEVNEETGEIRVLRLAAAQDVGKAVNPLNIRGQIEGAVVMGLGYALSEEFVQDDARIVTDDLRKLGVPRITDVPPIEVHIVEEPQPNGPFGAKGIGEVGVNPVAPAISNAVFDAVGVRLQSLPMKKEKVLAALRERADQ
jgi:CO/xanthine dehydrogenase Mo-binding subunit/aerobic-type carbon monoxide dehydrogenase small subunit (CoxS/CutS family)